MEELLVGQSCHVCHSEPKNGTRDPGSGEGIALRIVDDCKVTPLIAGFCKALIPTLTMSACNNRPREWRALLFQAVCNILGNATATSGCNSVVECLLPKQDVVGSNPIARSIFPNVPLAFPSFFVLTHLSAPIPLPVNWPCGKLPATFDIHKGQGALHGLRYPPRGRRP